MAINARRWRAASWAVRLGGSVALCSLLCACDTAGFKRAYMSLDQNGDRKRQHFFTDTESIYCVVELASGRRDVTVSAVIRATELFLPSGAVPVSQTFAVGEEAPGAGDNLVVSFELEKEDAQEPFVPGRFACELYLDGHQEETVEFDVQYPACPVPPAVDGGRCADYFLPGSVCSGAAEQSCVCSETGRWQCS